MGKAESAGEVAEAFGALFPEIHLRFYARRSKRTTLTPQSWAVLQHLAMTGPLSVGEAATYLGRAQSVVSEIIDGLAAKDLVARMLRA